MTETDRQAYKQILWMQATRGRKREKIYKANKIG